MASEARRRVVVIGPDSARLLALAEPQGAWRTFEVTASVEVLNPSGTTRVWLPAALWLFVTGHWVAGTFVALWSLFLVGTIDNVLKPMIISTGAKLPLLLIFIGVIGGLLQFGFLGLFIGPVLLGVGGDKAQANNVNLVLGSTVVHGVVRDFEELRA